MPNDPKFASFSLSINGKTHRDWQNYSITSSLVIPADAWNVTLGVPLNLADSGLKLWQPVKAAIDGIPVLEGRIDGLSKRTSKGQRTLSLRGRDLAGVLCDCSAPLFIGQDVTLEAVLKSVVQPLGISKISNRASKAMLAKATLNPGMKAWQVLEEVCSVNGCFCWFDPDGTLVIGGPDYTAKPVGTLILEKTEKGQANRTNVISLEVEQDISQLYSHVTMFAQGHGKGEQDGQHNIKAVVEDAELVAAGVYRPLFVVDGDLESTAQAEQKARKIAADARLEAFTVRAQVHGHYVSEALLWQPGQRVRVISQPDNLDATLFLMERTFNGGEGGQTTSLTLKEDGVWLLDAAKTPKAATAKAKSDLKIVDVA